jgi:inhibitor of cysteine peptidase
MEYNLNNDQEPVVIREQSSSSSVWYWVVALLVLALVGWYGYTAGWFSQRADNNDSNSLATEMNMNELDTMSNAAPIDSIRIETQESFPVGQVLVVNGSLPNGCTYLNQPTQLRDGNIFYINLSTRVEGEVCTEALVPYEERIPLQVNNLPAGVYVVNINGREISFELENDNQLDFNAGSDK